MIEKVTKSSRQRNLRRNCLSPCCQQWSFFR